MRNEMLKTLSLSHVIPGVEVAWKWVFEWWNWFYPPKLFPLDSQSQKSAPKPQLYQKISSLHIARETI